ncbi:IclR family transcriptional regulator [Demequina sp. B12]|uniref:IclR family transcriptional regulator n=1 Tax=Demequina sp. B12 TaxID=2992757 RepID=UPI00237A7FA9|nr:IclR family transcriptional regulator [Demequina sp. B12]MDE0571843.1 IclR family transcriptional regulator [Demequina sp. B12]
MTQSVTRGAEILTRLADGPQPITTLAEDFGVHRTTMYRELRSLEEAGLLRRDARGDYRLGVRLISLAQAALDQIDLRDTARPIIDALHHKVGGTVHLAALIDNAIVYVDKREDPRGIRLYSQVGRAVIPYCTASGKAVLSRLDPLSRDKILEDVTWKTYTPTTITSRRKLDEQLTTIAQQGYAIDDGEFESFVRCQAVPIIASHGVVGAVSMTSLRDVDGADALARHRPSLTAAATRIAQALG